ncbi:MAG: cell division protein FtsK, partial [Pseudonocardia sp.]|nr:cell division protein FtsK [Pseudonocardia sp.]
MSNRTAHASRFGGPAHSTRRTTRPSGREWRALAWLTRHPGFVLNPAALAYAVFCLGLAGAAIMYGVLAALTLVWWRAHPPTFDRFVAPRLRASWRRWSVYRGRRWHAVLSDCGLTREHRHTGEALIPRVLRVRSATPTIDTVYVRMARGQDVTGWQEKAPVLAEALIAHRVAITRHRPGVLAVVVEWNMPFDRVIPAPEIPETAAEVDLSGLEIGDNEHGEPFTASIVGGHRLVAGASGSGKGSILWSTLRAAGPCIRDNTVRIWMVDLKGGVETEQGAPLFSRYATTMAEALELLTEFRDAMRERQDWMRENNIRACTPSTDTPVELLVIDEMAMLTAYGDR